MEVEAKIDYQLYIPNWKPVILPDADAFKGSPTNDNSFPWGLIMFVSIF